MRFIRRVMLLCICLMCTLYAVSNTSYDSLTRESEDRYLLNESGTCVYTLYSDNVIKVNLSGFSNGVSRLLEEDYKIYSLSCDDKSIDIIIQNNELGVVYRYYYVYPERLLTCFCNTYENSYMGITYIIE